MQLITLITLCVIAIQLAKQTYIVATDLGRLLLVVAITSMVVCSPLADAMPVVDRLLSATIGIALLYRLLAVAWGPVPYRVLRQPPLALLTANSSAYRMQFGVRKGAFA